MSLLYLHEPGTWSRQAFDRIEVEFMETRKPVAGEILTCVVFIGLICMILALNIVLPAPAILEAERRAPAKMPELSLTSISSGSFMSRFEDYSADNFIFRDAFRGLHAFMVFNIYMQRDMSGLYRDKNVGLGEFRRMDAPAFRLSAQKVRNAAETFKGYGMNIYYSLIPDKSIYAKNYMPGFDLDAAESILLDVLGSHTYINIADSLTAGDYYWTDLHWDQSKIEGIANLLTAFMGAEKENAQMPKGKAGEFHGLYAGQIALPARTDTMSYANIEKLRVSYLNERTLEFEDGPVYDFGRFSGIDPYDFYLRGPQPLIVLENDDAPNRELYLFRDSFGSSLAPLLSLSYSKVTVIDLRYINLSLLDFFIDIIPGSDVLFIYGSQIFNNPSVLQA